MQELTTKIEQWATDRNLHTADPVKQMLKLIEEIGEIASGLARGNMNEVKDGIGDTKVVLTILKKQIENVGIDEVDGALNDLLWLVIKVGYLAEEMVMCNEPEAMRAADVAEDVLDDLAFSSGTSIEECTQIAYDEIKDRKGKMIDGVFVKNADITEKMLNETIQKNVEELIKKSKEPVTDTLERIFLTVSLDASEESDL